MCALRVQGAHDDDRPAPLLHGGDGVLDRRHDATDVDRENAVPFVEVDVFALAPARHDAGVGDDDIEATMPIEDRIDGAAHVVFDRDIAGHRLEAVGQKIGRFFQIEHESRRAGRGQRVGDRAPDAGRPAGHERDLPFEQRHGGTFGATSVP